MPLTIEHELNQAFADKIDKTLLSRIFKDDAAGKINIGELLQEDPVIEKKRKELGDRKIRLVQIKSELDRFTVTSTQFLLDRVSENDLADQADYAVNY